MQARVIISAITWDTDTDYEDADDIAAKKALPEAPFAITVDVSDRDEDTVLEAVLDFLSDTHGFLTRDVQYGTPRFSVEMDESSHYSSLL